MLSSLNWKPTLHFHLPEAVCSCSSFLLSVLSLIHSFHLLPDLFAPALRGFLRQPEPAGAPSLKRGPVIGHRHHVFPQLRRPPRGHGGHSPHPVGPARDHVVHQAPGDLRDQDRRAVSGVVVEKESQTGIGKLTRCCKLRKLNR